MFKCNHFVVFLVSFAMFVFAYYCSAEKDEADVVSSSGYTDLVSLFKEFQEFQKPKVINGIPDYSATAMKEQRQGLNEFQSRLVAIDISGWPI